PAALPPRGLHHYAALGVTDDKGGYQECCCRFDSLCALLQASAAKRPPGDTNLVLQPATPVTKATSTAAGTTKTGKAAKTAKTTKTVKVPKSG
ncbi:MAG TPA: DUF6519 domain-containing protein, partial [Rhodanobacter sp.]